MQIIFDEKLVPELKERYIVLELDTVKQPAMSAPATLYALIETLDLNTSTNLESSVKQHDEMVKNYKNSQWDSAVFDANALKGCWKGELDEFYDLVISTSTENLQKGVIWDGIRYTIPTED